MTRKIEQEMLKAIRERKNWKKDNTAVIQDEDCTHIYLYGHLIASIGFGRAGICMQGYNTRTTKSRLNAILREIGAGIHTKNGTAVLTYPDGKEEEMNSVCNYFIS